MTSGKPSSAAHGQKTTIAELVRGAGGERYLSKRKEHMKAMQEFIGIRKRQAGVDTAAYVRSLRRGSRLDTLHKQ